MDKGYLEVWPLLGGFDAWQSAGFPVEPVSAKVPALTTTAPARTSA